LFSLIFLFKESVDAMWEGLDGCYDHALQTEDCDTSCVREFYLDSDDTSGFSWFDGPLGGSAYGLDEIEEQIHNECELIKKLAPGTTEVVREQTGPDIENLDSDVCAAVDKGENTWFLVGTKNTATIKQRYSYVIVKIDDKPVIYTRHASVASEAPEGPKKSGRGY